VCVGGGGGGVGGEGVGGKSLLTLTVSFGERVFWRKGPFLLVSCFGFEVYL